MSYRARAKPQARNYIRILGSGNSCIKRYKKGPRKVIGKGRNTKAKGKQEMLADKFPCV